MSKEIDLFKDIIPSILEKSDYLFDDESEKAYVPFIVNKALSGHIDCVFYASDMNQVPFLDKKLQYDYYYFSIKKYKRRYQKWFKSTKDEKESLVMEYYNCNKERAFEILQILSEKQLAVIKEKLAKGGKF